MYCDADKERNYILGEERTHLIVFIFYFSPILVRNTIYEKIFLRWTSMTVS
jgi:hypothetical protein